MAKAKNKYTIGQFLAKRRTELNITQSDLSRSLGYSSPQFVSNWERGLCSPPLQIMSQLCDSLKISKKEVTELLLKQYRSEVEASLKR